MYIFTDPVFISITRRVEDTEGEDEDLITEEGYLKVIG